MNITKSALAGAIAVAALTAAVAHGTGGNPKAGQEKATACATCHGLDGRGRVPLAGKTQSYLLQRMTAIKDDRHGGNPIMQSIMAELSAQDLADLAAYYAAQSRD